MKWEAKLGEGTSKKKSFSAVAPKTNGETEKFFFVKFSEPVVNHSSPEPTWFERTLLRGGGWLIMRKSTPPSSSKKKTDSRPELPKVDIPNYAPKSPCS
jgi:hypothetical protein